MPKRRSKGLRKKAAINRRPGDRLAQTRRCTLESRKAILSQCGHQNIRWPRLAELGRQPMTCAHARGKFPGSLGLNLYAHATNEVHETGEKIFSKYTSLRSLFHPSTLLSM